MNDQQTRCDDNLLALMLADKLSEDDQDTLLHHVENCDVCQTRLSELAAPGDDWRLAAEVIVNRNSVDQVKPRVDLDSLVHQPDVWNERMAMQLLSPAAHPEFLGRLGRYDVQRLIGAGGMGIVFKAFDVELNRPVAIKLLAPYLLPSGAARKRFSREAQAGAAVVHPHVVPIHSVESADNDSPFIVMQYVDGESLQARLDREGPLGTREICRIGLQVADGLAAAHAQGLIHRDIKPANILLEQGVDRALIADFGLARAADDASLTRSGLHPGTPQFMSPEQASGFSVDHRSDLFSSGSMLYAMCTGRVPFRAETSLAVLRRIADSEPTNIREINPDIPAWLERLVQNLMAKVPGDRIQSAAEVRRMFEVCLQHIEHPATVDVPDQLLAPGNRAGRFIRSPLFVCFSAVALIATAILLGPKLSFTSSEFSEAGKNSIPAVDRGGSETEVSASDADSKEAGSKDHEAVQPKEKPHVTPDVSKTESSTPGEGSDFNEVVAEASTDTPLPIVGQTSTGEQKQKAAPAVFEKVTTIRNGESVAGTIGGESDDSVPNVNSIGTSRHLSDDGKTVLARLSGYEFQLFDAQKGTPISGKIYTEGHGSSGFINNKTAYTGGWSQSIRLWDTLTGMQIGDPLPHYIREDTWIRPAIGHDGKWLVTRPTMTTIQFWNAESHKAVTQPLQQKNEVGSLRFLGTGKLFVSRSGAELRHGMPRVENGSRVLS